MLKPEKVEELKEILAIQKQTGPSEQRTQELFINPILKSLNWLTKTEEWIDIDRRPRKTQTDKSKRPERPDYTLFDKNKNDKSSKPVVFVEAKKLSVKKQPGVNLGSGPLEQLRGYEKDKKNIVLLVLTDGNVWKFYLPAYLKGSKDFCYELELNTDKFEDYLNNLLGRNNVLSGKSSKYLKVLFHLDRINKEYESILSEMDEQPGEIASLVNREMKKFGFDSDSRELIQAAVDRMKSKLSVSDKNKRRRYELTVEWDGEIVKGGKDSTKVMGNTLTKFVEAKGMARVIKACNDLNKDKPTVMSRMSPGIKVKKIPDYEDKDCFYLAGLGSEEIERRLNQLVGELEISHQVSIKRDEI